MSSAVLAHTNGSTRHTPNAWMRQSVQQFFSTFNWEDHSPEIQELKQAAAQGDNIQALSLTLTVSQFFSAIDWNGSAIAATPNPTEAAPPSPGADAFTLEDFSDLF